MNRSLLEKIAEEGKTPLGLSLLFKKYPEALSGLLSDDALLELAKRPSVNLDQYSLKFLKMELEFRKKRSGRTLRLKPLHHESPFTFPVVFTLSDKLGTLCRPATVQLFHIQAMRGTKDLGRRAFGRAGVQAIELADTMIPGTDRPWVRPRLPELIDQMDQPSGALSFFFGSMCYLLGLCSPREVLCSARLKNGCFAPVDGIARKALVAAQDGFSYFVVSGKENAEQAKRALKNISRAPKIIQLNTDETAGKQFFSLIEQLTEKVSCWTFRSHRTLIRFLFTRAKQSETRQPKYALEQLERLETLFGCLSELGSDEASDALRLEILGELERLYDRFHCLSKADKAYGRLSAVCSSLLRKKRCPANFEDQWFSLPLRKGRRQLLQYQYPKAKSNLTKAVKLSENHWPPNLRFHGLCLCSLSKLHMHLGQSDPKHCQTALDYLSKASSKIDSADRPYKEKLIAETMVNQGRLSPAKSHFEKALEDPARARRSTRASYYRAQCLDSLIHRSKHSLQNVADIGETILGEFNRSDAWPWQTLTSVYRSLALLRAGYKDAATSLLIEASASGSISFNNGDWCNPVFLFPDLIMAWLAIRSDDRAVACEAISNLKKKSFLMKGDAVIRIFANPIESLDFDQGTKTLHSLRKMVTNLHYGVPAVLFDRLSDRLPVK